MRAGKESGDVQTAIYQEEDQKNKNQEPDSHNQSSKLWNQGLVAMPVACGAFWEVAFRVQGVINEWKNSIYLVVLHLKVFILQDMKCVKVLIIYY